VSSRTTLLVAAAACALAAACVLAAGCAGPRPVPAAPARSPETPAALARPEPDPACHGTVQGLLARSGLEQVTVSLSRDAAGRVQVLRFLSPDLTPAAQLELRRAIAACAFGGPLPPDGRAGVFTETFVRERAR
jgi:hypothetical protein